jgi:hypothetical protein
MPLRNVLVIFNLEKMILCLLLDCVMSSFKKLAAQQKLSIGIS